MGDAYVVRHLQRIGGGARLILAAFDLDGTLIDSLRDLADSVNELLMVLGAAPLGAGRVASMVGDGAGTLVRRALEARGLEHDRSAALAQFLDIYDRRLLDHTVAYDGVREALHQASLVARLAVLTNKPRAAAARILHHLQLAEPFDILIGGDGPFPRKPDPAGLREAIAQTGATHTVLVGDSPVDEQTARAGGVAFVFARYGFGAKRFGPASPDTSFVLDRPSDLAAVLGRFAAQAAGT